MPGIERRGAGAACLLRHAAAILLVAVLLGAMDGRAQSTNAPARFDYNAFRMISDRNIFNPNRYSRSGERSPTRSDSRSASRVESFTLVGLMAYEKGTFAFFDGTSSTYKKTLQVGAEISEFKLDHVTPDEVKLFSGTNEFVMRVGMQVRREDEGDWFLTTASEPTRNRVVVSRSRASGFSRGGPADGVPATMELPENGGPEIIILEAEPMAENSVNGNGNDDGNDNGTNGDVDTAGITDPVLLRLMQRRQELNQ